MLKFIINGQTLERADEEPPIRGTVGLKAAFLFRGNVWTEAESVAVRYDVGGGTTYEVLLDVSDNGYVESFVPWEALKKSRFTVACIAGSDTPTNGVAVVTAASGFRGEESPAPPSPTVYQQLLAKFNEAVEAVGSISGSKDEAAASAAAAAASAESAAAAKESVTSAAQEAKASATAASTSAAEAAKSASDAADVLEQAKEVGAAANEALKTAQSAVTEAQTAVKSAEDATAQAKAASEEVKASADKVSASTEAAAKSASNAAASETGAKEYARQAKASADAAAVSEANASTSKTAAAESATTAAARAADAAGEVTKAAGEVTKASTQASAAAASAEEAAGYARAASTSKDSAAASATEAAESAAGVGDQVTAAESAASTASAKAQEAAASAAAAKKSAEEAGAAAGGGVTSFNGRGGVVSPQAGDYTAEMVGAIPTSDKGKAGGVASLDESGKVLPSQLPAMDYDVAGSAEAVKTWVQGQNYLKEHQSLAGYATETWVEGKGYQTAEQVNTAIESAKEQLFVVTVTPNGEPTEDENSITYSCTPSATFEEAVAQVKSGKKVVIGAGGSDKYVRLHYESSPNLLLSDYELNLSHDTNIKAFYPFILQHFQWSRGGFSLIVYKTLPSWLGDTKPTYTASEVGADASGAAAQALTDAKAWVGGQGYATETWVTGKGYQTGEQVQAAVGAKADKPKRVSVTLTASGWNSSAKTQTVTVSGVLADESAQVIQPIPAIASQSAYNAAGILATGQAANSITFTASTVPTADLSVYVVITEVTA